MRSLLSKFVSLVFSRNSLILFVCLVSIFSALMVSKVSKVNAETTDDLDKVFGDPDKFIQSFEKETKDKSDEIVAFLVAAFGFRLVIKSFM